MKRLVKEIMFTGLESTEVLQLELTIIRFIQYSITKQESLHNSEVLISKFKRERGQALDSRI